MLLRLIYVVVILVTFAVCKIMYKENPNTTIREIHHYHIYDAAVKDIMKEILYEHMKEILYGYEYEPPIFPKEIKFWWEEPLGNRFNIFPGTSIDKIFQ